MVHLAGTPEQIGTLWGEMNKKSIVRDMEATYLKRAEAAGIPRETLIQRSAAYMRIAEEIAPHWLEEARAVARAAGVDEELYLAFIDGQSRNRFLSEEHEECTSYAVPRSHAKGGAILFHKTRDNVDRPQVAPIVDSSLEGVNKFLGVSDVSRIRCSMMVNEKGLAGSGDFPADRKPESSSLALEPAPPQYRGLMAGSILRHIAERAGAAAEALAIIENFVAKGWYSGGEVNASHWLFVDREGTILEVCNNARHVVHQFHDQDVYFSRFNRRTPARRLREAAEVDFHLFRSVSRQRPILTGRSISGLTVEIDPGRPEMLTCAWVAMPVRSVAFPVFMGQRGTPAALMDGTAYRLGKAARSQKGRWEEMERAMHDEKESLKERVAANLASGQPAQGQAESLEQWSDAQSDMLIRELLVVRP